MRLTYPALFFSLLLVAITASFDILAEVPGPTAQAMDQAIALVKPALVRIHVVSTEYDGGRELKEQSSGSGAIISKEGHVITNHHVAGHATRMFCTLSDRREIEADLVGTDPLTDIAVIKLRPDQPREFPVASFGDSSQLRVGEIVLALGSPLALSQSVTKGIVSNVEVIMPEMLRMWGGIKLDGEDVGSFVKWIGHDAVIAPGNSGGPLVNMQGLIVGINELEFGIGAAIPGNLARQVAEELITHGKVVRSWLGLSVQPVLKHSQDKRGALISAVISGSPAAVAGLQPGDILLQLNSVPINVAFKEELPAFNLLAAALPLNTEVSAVILRNGQEMPIKITPTERMTAKPKEHELKQWGMTASNISLIAAKEMKRDSREGVFITSLRPGGPAGDAKPPLTEKDIIVEAAGVPIRSIIDLQEFTRKLASENSEPKPVLTTFERKRQKYVTVVKVGIKELDDPGLEVRKAWLPVETQVITRDIAEQLGDPQMKGFRVTSVYQGSAAERAGIQVGDLILAVDDEKLTASEPQHYEELAALVRQYRIGDRPAISIRRGQEDIKLAVELVPSPKLNREMKEYLDENFDLTVREMGFFDRARELLGDSHPGVLVTEVKSGGWAAVAHINVGDVVTGVDGAPIEGIDTFERKMKELAESRPTYVVIQVLRKIYTVYIEVELNWDAVTTGKGQK